MWCRRSCPWRAWCKFSAGLLGILRAPRACGREANVSVVGLDVEDASRLLSSEPRSSAFGGEPRIEKLVARGGGLCGSSSSVGSCVGDVDRER